MQGRLRVSQRLCLGLLSLQTLIDPRPRRPTCTLHWSLCMWRIDICAILLMTSIHVCAELVYLFHVLRSSRADPRPCSPINFLQNHHVFKTQDPWVPVFLIKISCVLLISHHLTCQWLCVWYKHDDLLALVYATQRTAVFLLIQKSASRKATHRSFNPIDNYALEGSKDIS